MRRLVVTGVLVLLLAMSAPAVPIGETCLSAMIAGASESFYSSGLETTWVPFEEDVQTKQWMEVDLLHGLGYRGAGICIAIIDSGLFAHDYFTETLGTTLVSYVRVNDDYTLTRTSDWNDSVLQDGYGHGTKVTGTALQFAPEADLVFYSSEKRVGSSAWALDWYKVREALEDLNTVCIGLGVDILSISFGNRDVPEENPILAEQIETLLESIAAKGVTVVIASGNEYDLPISWPARIAPDTEGIICTGAVYDQECYQPDGWRAIGEIWCDAPIPDIPQGGTSHGSELELMTSGVDIMTTKNDGGGSYDFTGTSATAPMTAGCLACLLELWYSMSGFSTVPQSFIEGTLRNMAEYRYTLGPHWDDPAYYGDGVVSPYDCRIYPLSVAGSSVQTGYMFTSYDSEFYGHPYSVYLEWWEKKGSTWVKHNDLVAQTYYTDWNPFHAQNLIVPDFYQNPARIQWRYKIVVFGLSMTIATSWHTDYVHNGIDPESVTPDPEES